MSLGAIAATDRYAAIPASVTFPPRFGSHSYRRTLGFRRSGDKVSFPTTGTCRSIANFTLWKLVRQVLLVLLTNSCISETTDCPEHAAAVDAVTDGQRAIELERVTKPGNVGHIRDELRPPTELFRPWIVKGFPAVGCPNLKDVSSRKVRHAGCRRSERKR